MAPTRRVPAGVRGVLFVVLALSASALLAAVVFHEVRLASSLQLETVYPRQSVALLSGGGYAAVWETGSYPRRAVRLQFVRPDGSLALAKGGLAVASPAFDHSSPVVATHPTSGVFVAFTQGSTSGTGGGRLLVQWIDAQGKRRWPGNGRAVVEPFDIERYFSEPQLVPRPDGGVYACYMANSFLTIDTPIGCQRFSPSGKRLWSDAGRQAGGVPGWRVLPTALGDGAGGLLVFWRNQRDPFDDEIEGIRLEGQRFAPNGGRLWGPGRLVHDTRVAEYNSYTSDVLFAVPDGQGGAVLAFGDWTGSGEPSWDVVAQRVAPDGQLLWADGVAVVAGPLEEVQSAVVAAPDGGAFIAVWEVASPTRSRLLLFRLDPDGRHLWAEEGIALSDPAARANDFAAYGFFDRGLLRMAWTHQRRPATFTFDVRLALFDLAGARLSPPEGLPLTTAPDAQFLRGLVFDRRRGQGFAVWDDRRRGSWETLDVYGAVFGEQ